MAKLSDVPKITFGHVNIPGSQYLFNFICSNVREEEEYVTL